MCRVKTEVVIEEVAEALVVTARDQLAAAPKESVVTEEELGVGRNRALEGRHPSIHRKGDFADLAWALDLKAILRTILEAVDL